jgi:hypothetical protein
VEIQKGPIQIYGWRRNDTSSSRGGSVTPFSGRDSGWWIEMDQRRKLSGPNELMCGLLFFDGLSVACCIQFLVSCIPMFSGTRASSLKDTADIVQCSFILCYGFNWIQLDLIQNLCCLMAIKTMFSTFFQPF